MASILGEKVKEMKKENKEGIKVEECSFYFRGMCRITKQACDVGTKEQRCSGPMII